MVLIVITIILRNFWASILNLEHDHVIVHYLTYFIYFDNICIKIVIDDGVCVVLGRRIKSRSNIHMHQHLIAQIYVPTPPLLH